MPKRTIAVNYYTEKDGTIHDFDSEVELSKEEAERGDALGAFKESETDPAEVGGVSQMDNLNVHTPATHTGREGLTGTTQVVPELEDSEPVKDPDLLQGPADGPGDEAPADEFDSSGTVSKKAPAVAKKSSRRSSSDSEPSKASAR